MQALLRERNFSDFETSPISEGMSFVFNTLLSCRKNLREEDILPEVESIAAYLRARDCMIAGPYVIQLHSGNVVDNVLVLDIEIFMPIPRGTRVDPPYAFVPQLRIGNCVSMRYNGAFGGLRNTCDSLYRYMRFNGLKPVSDIYYIYKNGDALIGKCDFLCADICIGTRRALPPLA